MTDDGKSDEVVRISWLSLTTQSVVSMREVLKNAMDDVFGLQMERRSSTCGNDEDGISPLRQ